eukprot:GHVR01021274.1.p1 GENE.GHVR01021274.1~~GHVR01021274.1.p1  ORF type:complete len:262 (+),score=107.13 GHVR01021274.1:256-1041(+)
MDVCNKETGEMDACNKETGEMDVCNKETGEMDVCNKETGEMDVLFEETGEMDGIKDKETNKHLPTLLLFDEVDTAECTNEEKTLSQILTLTETSKRPILITCVVLPPQLKSLRVIDLDRPTIASLSSYIFTIIAASQVSLGCPIWMPSCDVMCALVTCMLGDIRRLVMGVNIIYSVLFKNYYYYYYNIYNNNIYNNYNNISFFSHDEKKKEGKYNFENINPTSFIHREERNNYLTSHMNTELHTHSLDMHTHTHTHTQIKW